MSQERELELLGLSRREFQQQNYPCGAEPNDWDGDGPLPEQEVT